MLDMHLEEKGGKVKAYTLISGSMNSLMRAGGREKVSEYVVGPGLSESKNAISEI